MSNLIQALRAYQQGDAEGVMVLVSRQACDEAADVIERLNAEVLRLEEHAVVLANTERHVERERWQQAAEAMAQEADHRFTMDGTAAHWLRALVQRVCGPNLADKRHGTVLRDGSA